MENPAQQKKVEYTETSWNPICMLTTVPVVESGKTCMDMGASVILRKVTCNEAAKALGKDDVTATLDNDDGFPYGCYYNEESEQLWLNSNGANRNHGFDGIRT